MRESSPQPYVAPAHRRSGTDALEPRLAGAQARWPQLRSALVATPVRASLTGKALEAVTLVALATVVPRVLGPAQYGEFAVALSIVMIGSLAMAPGGPTLLSRYVPSAPEAERAALARALVSRLLRWRVAAVAVAALVAGVLVLAAPGDFPPAVTGMVFAALVFEVLGTLGFQVGLALGRTTLWSFRWPAQNAGLVITAVALGSLAGSTGAIAGLTIGSGGAFLAAWAMVARRLRDAPRRMPVPPGALAFGAVNAAAVSLTHLYQRGGVVAVTIFGGSTVQAGFAGLAMGLSLAVLYAVAQAFAVQLPSLAERVDADRAGAEAVARRLAARLQALLLPVAVCGALASEPLVRLVFGEPFQGAAQAMVPALALLPLAPLSAQASQVAALRLQPGRRLAAAALGAAVFACVAALGVPAWGATGATLAVLLGTVGVVLVAALALPACFTRTSLAIGLVGSAVVLGALALV